MKKIALLAALFAVFACSPAAKNTDNTTPKGPVPVTVPTFAKGADISWASEMEANSRTFQKKDGTVAPLLDVLKDCGINAIRLRVWVNPFQGWSGKDDVVAAAKKVTYAGLPLMVDFHYSDFFTQPDRQKIPAAWEADKADIDKMCKHVTDHTTEVLQALKDAGVHVEWIQVGNETPVGMLFPLGSTTSGHDNFAKLYMAGYNAAKDVYPKALVMPHVDAAHKNRLSWFKSLQQAGGKFDMVALSHYPQAAWNGKTQLAAEQANTLALATIRSLASELKVPVVVSEVGVITAGDSGVTAKLEADGKQVLKAFMDEVKKIDGCVGVFYWEPQVDGLWRPLVYTRMDVLSRYTEKTESNYWPAYKQGAFSRVTNTASVKPTSVMDVFAD